MSGEQPGPSRQAAILRKLRRKPVPAWRIGEDDLVAFMAITRQVSEFAQQKDGPAFTLRGAVNPAGPVVPRLN